MKWMGGLGDLWVCKSWTTARPDATCGSWHVMSCMLTLSCSFRVPGRFTQQQIELAVGFAAPDGAYGAAELRVVHSGLAKGG